MKETARRRARAKRSPEPDLTAVLEAARRARASAHAPYSRYRVGAAILTRGGHVYAGCNVENATYGATICAERSAICAMVAAGDRNPVLCIVVTQGPEPGAPCGICRQVLAEFAANGDMALLLVADSGSRRGGIDRVEQESLKALFPHAFSLKGIGGKRNRKTSAHGKRSSSGKGHR